MGWGWGYCSWSALIYNADISARVMSLVSPLYFCGRGRFITQHRGIKPFLLLTPLLWCKGPRPSGEAQTSTARLRHPPPGAFGRPVSPVGPRRSHAWGLSTTPNCLEGSNCFLKCTVLKPHSKKRSGESVEEHNTHTASIEKQMVPTEHPHLTVNHNVCLPDVPNKHSLNNILHVFLI